jgi:transcriptional regulator with XRE-family HTH domain
VTTSASETRDWPAGQPILSFAGLLRQLRTAARLTQEELAEAAGLSPRSISDLERGVNRTAHKDTALLLADALGIEDRVRTAFVAAARGRAPVSEVLAAIDSPLSAKPTARTMTFPQTGALSASYAINLERLLDAAAAGGSGRDLAGICVIVPIAGISIETKLTGNGGPHEPPRSAIPCRHRLERGRRSARTRTSSLRSRPSES